MEEPMRSAVKRYRKYKARSRWLVPTLFIDLGLFLALVVYAKVSSHSPKDASGVLEFMALYVAVAATLLLLVVAMAAISKCPFCGRRVRSYPSATVHCIHCGRNIPDDFPDQGCG